MTDNIRPGTRFCVISHTHWDREWYWPFEVLRTKLVDLIDHLLDILDTDPGYVFHLDAQTIVLDDYLAIRPEREEDLSAYIRAGRILVGPWYVQNDLFLTSGELTVRNLLIGTAIAARHGGDQRVGYTPDQFGLPEQLPQILSGFGIDHCVFGRGYALHDRTPEGLRARSQANEFTWAAPGDTAVLGVFMRTWYNNAQRFPADLNKSLRFLDHVDAGLRDTARTHLRLCMNGVDHLEAQPDLTAVLAGLNERLAGKATIEQVSFPEYIRDLHTALEGQDLDLWQGELREGPDGSVLQGTLSSRPYLKRGQNRCQVLLENLIEPLYTMIAIAGWPEAYPRGHLLYLWKIMLENSAHDNICGCSRDAVHRHMEDHYARVDECGRELVRRGVKFLVDRLAEEHRNPDEYLLALVNTLSFQRDACCETTIHLPVDENLADFELRDAADRIVPCEIVSSRRIRKGMFSPDNLPGDRPMTACQVRFPAKDLPAFSHAVYRFTPRAASEAPAALPVPAMTDGETVEVRRRHTGVRLHGDGRVDVWNAHAEHWHEDVLTFTSESDLGSAYAFVPAPGESGPVKVDLTPEVTVLEHTGLCTRLRMAFTITTSAAYDWEAGRRTPETASIPVELVLTLDDLHDWVTFDATIDNHVKDFRLRMLVHTGASSDVACASDPFGWSRRDRGAERYELRSNRCEPSTGFAYLESGFAVFSEALTEYEHLGDAPDTMAFSLFRANASHTAPGLDLAPIAQDMPEEWVSVENQCQRVIQHRFALAPGVRSMGELARDMLDFQAPVLMHFDSGDRRKLVGGRPSVQQTDLQETFYREPPEADRRLGLTSSVAEVDGHGVLATALKVAEAGGAQVLRLVNMSTTKTACRLRVHAPIREVRASRLDETPGEVLALEDGCVPLQLGSKEIRTLLLYT